MSSKIFGYSSRPNFPRRISWKSDESFPAILKQARRFPQVTSVRIHTDSSNQAIKEVSVRAVGLEDLAESKPGDIGKLAASQLELSDNYYESVLKQARRSFIAAVVSATTGVVFFLIAVAIVEFRHGGSAATLSAIGGGLVETISGLNFWLFGKTSSQLDAFHVRLDRLQTFLLANSVCENIDGESKYAVRADLVIMMAGGQPINKSNQSSSRPKTRSAKATAKAADLTKGHAEESGQVTPSLDTQAAPTPADN